MNIFPLVCGLFFAAVTKQLSSSNRKGSAVERLCDAFEAGIQSVESYARVQPGDKSLLDALIPAVDFIKSKTRQGMFTAPDWKELAIIADQAAQDTRSLIPKVGRAAYTQVLDVNTPDPGACAVAIILQAISEPFIKASVH